MSDEATKSRRCYGRGVFDGLKKAGIENPGEFMNAEKIRARESGLSAQARKVLECVPVDEPIATHFVNAAMVKQGHASNLVAVSGCLNYLKNQGLLKEPKTGEWTRIQAKAKPALSLAGGIEITESAFDEAPEPSQPGPPMDPITRMGEIARRLRDTTATLVAIASEIEDVMLEQESRVEKIHGETAKLRQLKELLREIG